MDAGDSAEPCSAGGSAIPQAHVSGAFPLCREILLHGSSAQKRKPSESISVPDESARAEGLSQTRHTKAGRSLCRSGEEWMSSGSRLWPEVDRSANAALYAVQSWSGSRSDSCHRA